MLQHLQALVVQSRPETLQKKGQARSGVSSGRISQSQQVAARSQQPAAIGKQPGGTAAAATSSNLQNVECTVQCAGHEPPPVLEVHIHANTLARNRARK